MNIIFFGTPEFVRPVIETLKHHFNLIAIITTPDQKSGRKQLLTPPPVKQIAEKHSIPVLQFSKLNSDAIEEIKKLQPDLFVVAAYGKIIPQAVLDIPRSGAINIHPSLLPKYRGASPIQAALLNGDTQTGVTLIRMDAQMDHGAILTQETVPLSPEDTLESLHTTLFEKAAHMIIPTITEFIAGNLLVREQEHTRATYCNIIKKEDAYIDQKYSQEQIERVIRAYYPWPIAWTRLQMANGKEQIIKLFPDKTVQLEGKKRISIKEFLNGYPETREFLEKIYR